MSTRTLSRRLQEEGSSHQKLLDELRHSLAVRYLDDDRRTIAEVSFMLGFADPSAFSRAFKRWSGQSPRDRNAPR
jgi:AraC-like DNA-binding protein